jgi:hypothetical protein
MGIPFAHGPKKDGLWRPCGDYLQWPAWLYSVLKNRSCQGLSPNPCRNPEDIPKTAIITPFGLFEYLFTPFWLSNAAQTFQRMMD